MTLLEVQSEQLAVKLQKEADTEHGEDATAVVGADSGPADPSVVDKPAMLEEAASVQVNDPGRTSSLV